MIDSALREAIVAAAIEWRAARIDAIRDDLPRGAWDRLSKAEHVLSDAVKEFLPPAAKTKEHQ